MSGYNSENTKVLETYDDNGNLRMLLMHEMDCGRREYVIGSYFQQKSHWERPLNDCEGGWITEYSWDWGHYFGDVMSAVAYWNDKVIGKE